MTVDPDTIDAAFAPTPSPDVAWVELDGETVVYHETTNSTMVLDPTASTLWLVLDGTADLATIAADFADVYGAPRATVEEDLVALARQMARYGLFEGIEAQAQRAMAPLPARLDEDCDDDGPDR